MNKYLCTSALSVLLGVTAVTAAPQNTSSAPAPQEQPAPSAAPATSGRHASDPNRQLKYLTKHLQLTGDQQNQVLAVLQQHEDQMQAVRSDNTLTQDDRRAKLRDIRQDSHAQVHNLLNDTQKQQFDQMRQNARAHAKEKRNQATSTPAGL